MNRVRIVTTFLVVLTALASGMPAEAGYAQAAEPAPVDLPPTAEEQLAAAYAPVLYLARQRRPCDPGGDPYDPAPVEVVLDDPAVALRADAPGRPILGWGPTAADLFRRDRSVFLDLPGNPRRPGCVYERRYRARIADQPAVAYAHIVASEAGLALQYWFFFYFNGAGNPHEGDWEMIQLAFDAATAEEALTQAPLRVAFAQHAGGEAAAWTDAKLRTEDGHPVVYVSHDSHAAYFAPGVYLGYGEDGAGFGCDDAARPARRVAVAVRLVPADVADQRDPLAWLAYDGRWGELGRTRWNGPTGPTGKGRWSRPFEWEDGLRASSIRLADRVVPGPDPAGGFCALVETGAVVLGLLDRYPSLGYATLAAVLAVVALLGLLARRTLVDAALLFFRHLRAFTLIGLALLPIGVAVNVLQALLATLQPVEMLLKLTNRSPGFGAAVALTIGGLEQLVVLVLVVPAVVHAVAESRAGRPPDPGAAYRAAFSRIGALARSLGWAVGIVFGLALSVVGLPWAIRQAVRWYFVPQALVLDGTATDRAHQRSARVVAGRWWRTAATVAVLTLVGYGVGPLVGILLLVFSPASLAISGTLSGVVYAATVPYTAIGATLLYEELSAAERSRQRQV